MLGQDERFGFVFGLSVSIEIAYVVGERFLANPAFASAGNIERAHVGESIEMGATVGKFEHLTSAFQVRRADFFERKVKSDFGGAMNNHANLAL